MKNINKEYLISLFELYIKFQEPKFSGGFFPKDIVCELSEELLNKILVELIKNPKENTDLIRIKNIHKSLVELLEKFGVLKGANIYSIEQIIENIKNQIEYEQSILKKLLQFETILPINKSGIDKLVGINETSINEAFGWLRSLKKEK